MTFLWAEDIGQELSLELGLGDCRTPAGLVVKMCGQRSQIANVVLDLRFVPARHNLDKRLIRLSLGTVFGRV
jgi:hypothetical protein